LIPIQSGRNPYKTKNPEHSARGLSNLQAESFICMSGQSVETLSFKTDFDKLSLTVVCDAVTSIETQVDPDSYRDETND
jgi:hypothetical protein